MATTDTRLRVAIIGSGIAGLAAARILREKHKVTVYERGEPSLSTGGQGIANYPNSTHILKDIGFDYKRVGSVELGGWKTVDKFGKHLHSTDFNMRERYGSPLVSHMRVDVRTELLRLATAPPEDLGLDASAAPTTMVWNNGAIDLEAEAGRVMLEDGSTIEADVVIDGIHSRLRNKILDEPVSARKTGLTTCRVAVSAEDAEKALGKLPQWWEDQRKSDQGYMYLIEALDGTSRMMVTFPLRDCTWMNMAWIFPTRKEREDTAQSWDADGDRDEILDIYHDFDDEMKTLLRVGNEVKLWELQDLEPLPSWASGRAILIGDAAHAMTPLQGQGANMAIEDADGLRLLTQPGITRDDVPDVLKKIESFRRPRATRVLMNTRSASTVSNAADRYCFAISRVFDHSDCQNEFRMQRPSYAPLQKFTQAFMAFSKLFAGCISIFVVAQLTLASISSGIQNGSIQESLQSFDWKPRIFIMSDILNEPDDSMSLVRYLLYSNEFETEGLCATTSWWLKNATHVDEMKRIIEAYGDVVDNLNQHVHPTSLYQSAEELSQLLTSGPKARKCPSSSAIPFLLTYGLAALNATMSDGALRIISSLQESNEPLFIAAWGGTNTLAQALYYMDNTMTSAEARELRSRIRLYTISDQDNSGAWIRTRYPDLFYVISIHAFNEYPAATWPGINVANCPCVGNETVLNPWLDKNIRLGPLGSVYPQIQFGMEGDTPSFLWLVQNGLVYRDRIDWGTWGGRYSLAQAPDDDEGFSIANHFVNAADSVIGADGNIWETNQASIWRWRSAYQDDFAARMQWTLTPNFTQVGHPPVLNVNGHQGPDPLFVKVKTNQTYTFSANLTYDPDHPVDNSKLIFLWGIYPEPTRFIPDYIDIKLQALRPATGDLSVLNDASFAQAVLGSEVQITAPAPWSNPYTGQPTGFHLVLQVTNSAGHYPIRRYMRIVCEYGDV
ncbi:hypothetical protein NUW58_g344 [Xylaria curta]|uniref:Uncharacterized protein n=2 Tax=Xylaria curta TaxID=42375 RepID=A0ACC1PR00_9PEZI|nr:hypothetical protein NUW58_g2585 [Xylaria curta]KAJ2998389.1 hypothetical protein NUW58_g344 [Xylaria curta]